MTELEKARIFATARHSEIGQTYSGYPYVIHLLNVENILKEFGHDTDELLTVAWLHDVVEDTHITFADLARVGISSAVVSLVDLLTDGVGQTRRERQEHSYPRIAQSPKAQIVKCADRLSHVRGSLQMGDQGKNYLQTYVDEHEWFREHITGPTAMVDALDLLIEEAKGILAGS